MIFYVREDSCLWVSCCPWISVLQSNWTLKTQLDETSVSHSWWGSSDFVQFSSEKQESCHAIYRILSDFPEALPTTQSAGLFCWQSHAFMKHRKAWNLATSVNVPLHKWHDDLCRATETNVKHLRCRPEMNIPQSNKLIFAEVNWQFLKVPLQLPNEGQLFKIITSKNMRIIFLTLGSWFMSELAFWRNNDIVS